MDAPGTGPIQPWRSRTLARAAFATWIAAHLGVAAGAVLPPRLLGGGKLPWSMFADPTPFSARIVAEAYSDGSWHRLPLDRWFHYRRGATTFRLPDEAPPLMGRRPNPGKRQFASWLATRARTDLGLRPTRIRLRRRLTRVDGGGVRVVDLGTWEIE